MIASLQAALWVAQWYLQHTDHIECCTREWKLCMCELKGFSRDDPYHKQNRLNKEGSTSELLKVKAFLWVCCLFCSLEVHILFPPTQHNTTQHNTTLHNTTQHNTTQHRHEDLGQFDKALKIYLQWVILLLLFIIIIIIITIIIIVVVVIVVIIGVYYCYYYAYNGFGSSLFFLSFFLFLFVP